MSSASSTRSGAPPEADPLSPSRACASPPPRLRVQIPQARPERTEAPVRRAAPAPGGQRRGPAPQLRPRCHLSPGASYGADARVPSEGRPLAAGPPSVPTPGDTTPFFSGRHPSSPCPLAPCPGPDPKSQDQNNAPPPPAPPAALAPQDGLSVRVKFPRLFDVTSCPSLLPRRRPPPSPLPRASVARAGPSAPPAPAPTQQTFGTAAGPRLRAGRRGAAGGGAGAATAPPAGPPRPRPWSGDRSICRADAPRSRTRAPPAPGAEGAGTRPGAAAESAEPRARPRPRTRRRRAPGSCMPGRWRRQRDMQPARKLLSLLFLILMGTELTQVRASNAIFLSARERRPPGPRGTQQSRGAAQRSGRGAPRLGSTAERPLSGWREGCRLTETGGASRASPDPQPPASQAAQGGPLPAEKFGDPCEGSFGCYCFWGEAGQRVRAPGVLRGGSALTPSLPPAPRTPHPWSIPASGCRAALGAPRAEGRGGLCLQDQTGKGRWRAGPGCPVGPSVQGLGGGGHALG